MGFFIGNRLLCPITFRKLLTDDERPVWYGISRPYAKRTVFFTVLMLIFAGWLFMNFTADRAFFNSGDMTVVIMLWLFVTFAVGTLFFVGIFGRIFMKGYLLTDRRLVIRDRGIVADIPLENIEAVTLGSEKGTHISLSFRRAANSMTVCEYGRNKQIKVSLFGRRLKVRHDDGITVLDVNGSGRLMKEFERLVCADGKPKDNIAPLIFRWKCFLDDGERILWKGKSIQFMCFSKIPDILPLIAAALMSINTWGVYLQGWYTKHEVLSISAKIFALCLIPHCLLNLVFIIPMKRYALTDRRLLIYGRKGLTSIDLKEIVELDVSGYSLSGRHGDHTHMNGYHLVVWYEGGHVELEVNRPDDLKEKITAAKTEREQYLI